MMNGSDSVLVSWAVPKNMPTVKGKASLAIHVPDHPFGYAGFSGTIEEGNYGAGEVRIFDSGTYEMLKQAPGKLTFRLEGKRLKATYHMVQAGRDGKDEWLVLLSEQMRPPSEPPPEPSPMLATLAEEAFDDPNWTFEPKWDGVRALAYCDQATRLVSRNNKDITGGYPELSKIHERLVCLDAVIDGEIVAMDGGRPSFELLQTRMHVRNPREVARLAKAAPVTFVAFDIIYLDGKALSSLPFEDRRLLLEGCVVGTPWLQVSPSIRGEGTALFDAARQQNLEGVIAKRLKSRYEPGRRSKSWLKIKSTFEADLVIGGYSRGEGRRAGEIGSLLMGAFEEGELRFVGSVGTGFSEATLKMLKEKLQPLITDVPAFSRTSLEGDRKNLKLVDWVRPELVATVEFRQTTAAFKLRAPSYKGLRQDKTPMDCLIDQLHRAR